MGELETILEKGEPQRTIRNLFNGTRFSVAKPVECDGPERIGQYNLILTLRERNCGCRIAEIYRHESSRAGQNQLLLDIFAEPYSDGPYACGINVVNISSIVYIAGELLENYENRGIKLSLRVFQYHDETKEHVDLIAINPKNEPRLAGPIK